MTVDEKRKGVRSTFQGDFRHRGSPCVWGIVDVILSLPRVVNFKFLLQPHQKYYITQYGEFFIDYSEERLLCCPFSLPHLCIFSLKGWENVLFELGRERVKSLGNAQVMKTKIRRPKQQVGRTDRERFRKFHHWGVARGSKLPDAVTNVDFCEFSSHSQNFALDFLGLYRHEPMHKRRDRWDSENL